MPRPWGLSPAVAGTACCVASALGYTAANICMRQLAELGASEFWAICIKEFVTVAVVGPWLLARVCRRMVASFSWRWIGALFLIGLSTQLLGNLPVQWAFGVVGLAVTIPAIFGTLLAGSAIMGLLLLGERVSSRSTAAIGLLLGSIVLLSVGAVLAGRWVPGTPSPAKMALGVGAGCLAGLVYAMLTIAIRTATSRGIPVSAVVLVVTGAGVISLGGISISRFGVDALLQTPAGQWGWMVAAGTFNLLAFLAITKGLQLTAVVHANVLNASQIAMGAVAGILCFGESGNIWLVLGICLTIAGVVLIGPSQPEEPDIPGG